MIRKSSFHKSFLHSSGVGATKPPSLLDPGVLSTSPESCSAFSSKTFSATTGGEVVAMLMREVKREKGKKWAIKVVKRNLLVSLYRQKKCPAIC